MTILVICTYALFLTPLPPLPATPRITSRLNRKHLCVLPTFGAPPHAFHVGFTSDLRDPTTQRLFLGFCKHRQTRPTKSASRVVVEVQNFRRGFSRHGVRVAYASSMVLCFAYFDGIIPRSRDFVACSPGLFPTPSSHSRRRATLTVLDISGWRTRTVSFVAGTELLDVIGIQQTRGQLKSLDRAANLLR